MAPPSAMPSTMRGAIRSAIVVGAGAFGGWTALHLLRRGVRVMLVDAWGAGHSRASSGGETRIIRGLYGGQRRYIEMTARALALWKDAQRRWGEPVYVRTGGLWMFVSDDTYARASLSLLDDVGLSAREMPLTEARRRFPQCDMDGVTSVFVEPATGYLLARRACERVRESFVAEGGEYRQAWAEPDVGEDAVRAVHLSHDGGASPGERLEADAYVFCLGAWMGRTFPNVVGDRVRPTRQEVFYFGAPAGDARFGDDVCPVWGEFTDRLMYGIPGNERRGFKVADDAPGPRIDPSTEDRVPTVDALARCRELLARRFPALARAPLVEARVCQYESTPDGHFIVDRHPAAENAWIAGGGSGHGFKFGPALGEHIARLVLGEDSAYPEWRLSRFDAERGEGDGPDVRPSRR